MTPPDIYASMHACALEDRVEDAVFAYSAAGTFARFDMLRVTDRTAHQVHTILLMRYRDTVPPEKWSPVNERVQAMAASPDESAAFCRRVRAIGPPAYHPQYMMAHGMGVFTGGGSPLVEGFDAHRGWDEALTLYLRCAGSQP